MSEPNSTTSADRNADEFTSEETMFFATGDAMDAVVHEDAAAEAWEGDVLAASPRRWPRLPLGARVVLVMAVAGGLFLLGSWLFRSEHGPVARANPAISTAAD
jgi:hypothetical protein